MDDIAQRVEAFDEVNGGGVGWCEVKTPAISICRELKRRSPASSQPAQALRGAPAKCASKRTHILVKPFSVGLRTNLVITTDRRTYHLRLENTSATAMAAISWTYPADELIALRRQQEAAAAAKPIASGLSIESLNFNYVISGDRPAWRPLRAFDDGRQTYIEFAPSIAVGEASPLSVIGDGEEAQLVNYRVAGRYYVVDRMFGAAELRLGGKHQKAVRITRGDAARASRRRRS